MEVLHGSTKDPSSCYENTVILLASNPLKVIEWNWYMFIESNTSLEEIFTTLPKGAQPNTIGAILVCHVAAKIDPIQLVTRPQR